VKPSGFEFSARSWRRLHGVHPKLIACTALAINITKQDFSVIEGLRTRERQRFLVAQGKSLTMHSKHLGGIEGFATAVDLAPWVDGALSWGREDFYPVVQAMALASEHLNVSIKWGGAWIKIESHLDYEAEVEQYETDHPGTPFVDAPHFELI